jgi:hypothetical protein
MALTLFSIGGLLSLPNGTDAAGGNIDNLGRLDCRGGVGHQSGHLDILEASLSGVICRFNGVTGAAQHGTYAVTFGPSVSGTPDVYFRRNGAAGKAIIDGDGAGGPCDLDVPGQVGASAGFAAGGTPGKTQTVTIRDGSGSPVHTLQFVGGILTDYTTA